MLVLFDHARTQVRYGKAAMDEIDAYRPDGKSPGQIETFLLSADAPRATYLTTREAITNARLIRQAAVLTLHAGNVDFSTQARSVFRKDKLVLERLARLPTDDRTLQESMARADAILALWPGLPDVARPDGSVGAFRFNQGSVNIDFDAFQGWRTAAGDADDNIAPTDQTFQTAEGKMREKLAEMEDFAQAAITQGMSQFAPGTTERNLIEAIPTDPPQHAPGVCTITSAIATAPGTVHVVCASSGATGFDVFDLAPGAPAPGQLLEDEIGTEFDLTDLPPGVHVFTAQGANAKGRGLISPGVTVTVT